MGDANNAAAEVVPQIPVIQGPPVYTVAQAMERCGFSPEAGRNHPINEATTAAKELFGNTFRNVTLTTTDQLKANFKALANLSATQGKIAAKPSQVRNVKAFHWWVKHEMILGRDPSSVQFDASDEHVETLLTMEEEMTLFLRSAETEPAKPDKLKESTRWEDWKNVFISHLRCKAGVKGYPLTYIIRDNDTPDTSPKDSVLDLYVAAAPLNGRVFEQDTRTVHNIIQSLIAGNRNAEGKLAPLVDDLDGRKDFQALVDHYEGTGPDAMDLQKANNFIAKQYYGGEKSRDMCWDVFEAKLVASFVALERHYGVGHCSPQYQLDVLMEKVQAPFLSLAKETLEAQRKHGEKELTFAQALKHFRDKVNTIHGPGRPAPKANRRVAQVGGKAHKQKGKPKAAKGRKAQTKFKHPKLYDITLTDGTKLAYHPSYNYTDEQKDLFKPADMQKYKQARRDYWEKKNGGGNKSGSGRDANQQLSEMNSTMTNGFERMVASINEMGSRIPGVVSTDGAATAASSIGTTVMGGRNEQHALRRGGQRSGDG